MQSKALKRNLASLVVAVAAGCAFTTVAYAETELRLGHVWPPTEIHAQAAEQFAQEVSEVTGGEVTVEIFGGSSLGSDREILEGLRLGTADIWLGGAGVLSSASDTARIFTVPFMFDDLDHFQAVYNGDVGRGIADAIESESGYQVVSYWMRGPRWLTTKERVETPEDLAGMKIRVPDSLVFVRSWEQLGAAPTPMNFGEVFTALQQSVIDGQENPLSLIYTAQFPEVVSYLGQTEHVMEPITMVVTSRRFQELSDEHQQAVIAAANGAAQAFVAEQVLAGETDFLQRLQDAGMTLVEVDKDAFRAELEGFVGDNFPELTMVHQQIRDAAQ